MCAGCVCAAVLHGSTCREKEGVSVFHLGLLQPVWVRSPHMKDTDTLPSSAPIAPDLLCPVTLPAPLPPPTNTHPHSFVPNPHTPTHRYTHPHSFVPNPHTHTDPREEAHQCQELWHLGALPVTYWLPQHVQGGWLSWVCWFFDLLIFLVCWGCLGEGVRACRCTGYHSMYCTRCGSGCWGVGVGGGFWAGGGCKA